MKNGFLILVLMVITHSVLAQVPLRGFIIGADTSYLQYEENRTFSALVFRGAMPETGYTLTWYSEPEGYVSPFGTADNNLTINGAEFDLFCLVKDDNGDSLLLQQHVIIKENLDIFVGNLNEGLYAFTGKERMINVLFESFQSISGKGYSISTSGTGAQYLTLESQEHDIAYQFNCPLAGMYNLVFTLKDQNNVILAVSEETIHVVDIAEHGTISMKQIYIIGESYSRQFILPEAITIDSVQWKTSDPSSPFFGNHWITDPSTYLPFHGEYYSYSGGYEVTFQHIGTFSRSANIFLRDGQVITLTKDYIVTDKVGITAGSVQACNADTVSIPFIYSIPDAGYKLRSFILNVNFDNKNLMPVGINRTPSSPDIILVTNQDNLLILRNHYRPGNFYEPDDTLFTMEFVILNSGTHKVSPESLPGNIQFKVQAGEISSRKANFTVNSISGMPLLYQLLPEDSYATPNYSWTFGFDSKSTSTEKNPVISHSLTDKKQEICLKISSNGTCVANTCDSIIWSGDRLFTISGFIENNAHETTKGVAIAYLLQDGKYYPAGKDTANPDGSFTIENLEKGNYVLLGIPENVQLNAAYYYGEGSRVEATIIPVTGNVTDVNLTLPSKTGTLGQSIRGTFNKDSLTQSHENIFEKFYGELPSVVFLTNEAGETINWSVLDETNGYTIANLSKESTLKATYGRVNDELINHHILTSLMDSKGESMKCYPNPFHNEIIVEATEDISLECLNLQGKVVFQQHLQKGRNQLNTSDLTAGSYIILIRDDKLQESFQVFKF